MPFKKILFHLFTKNFLRKKRKTPRTLKIWPARFHDPITSAQYVGQEF